MTIDGLVLERALVAPSSFSLAQTCGPVAWGRGRWPNHDWLDRSFVWVGWEDQSVVWRTIRPAANRLQVTGSASPANDAAWANAVLGLAESPPSFADPVIAALALRYPGLRTYAQGSLFDGLITSIVGQSISVAAAAITEARLAALFHGGIELAGRRFWPAPRADQLAAAEPALIRQSGVTWRRAEAIVAAARAALDGLLPDAVVAHRDPDLARAALRSLPLVGPWTAESALLWGIGLPDAHPTGDVALLRAARAAYARPDLTLKSLDLLAEAWRPARGWAARLLWTDLLGPAERC